MKTSSCQPALPLGQSLAGGWKIKENEARADGPARGCCAFDDEEPSPSRDAVRAVKPSCNATGNETAESAGKDGSRYVHGEPLALLRLLVPRAEQKQHTGRETTFQDADSNTETDQALVAGHPAHADSHQSPEEHDGWEEDGRTRPREHHVGG